MLSTPSIATFADVAARGARCADASAASAGERLERATRKVCWTQAAAVTLQQMLQFRQAPSHLMDAHQAVMLAALQVSADDL
jgi:hypothetical protein